MLYNDYRPTILDEVIGHSNIVKALKKRFKEKDIPHVILLTGITGIGKCVTDDTLILTDDGFSYINWYSSSLKGFNIFNKEIVSLEEKNSLTEYFYEEDKCNTIKIKSDFGFEIEGTPEHPVLCFNQNCDIIFKKLEDVEEGDVIIIKNNISQF